MEKGGNKHKAEIFQVVVRQFWRGFDIAALAAILSLGLAGKVRATYLNSDVSGDYIDRGWYYLLDDGQYYYLDRGQYNLLGGLSYQLGHPCYPKLFERGSEQEVGFSNRVNTGWFSFGGDQVPISEYAVWSHYFNAGDYIDRVRYYYLDKGQYHYLDREQYNLLGELGYTFGYSYYLRSYIWSPYQPASISATPELSTILYLVLGVFGILALKRY